MTNAEFLNMNFGTNYKQWMKCRWPYSDDLKVWMLYFDNNIRLGWKNEVLDNTITEIFVDSLDRQIMSHRYFEETYRLVVDKAQNYKILGVYKYSKEDSNIRTKRVWKKVAKSLDEFIDQKGENN